MLQQFNIRTTQNMFSAVIFNFDFSAYLQIFWLLSTFTFLVFSVLVALFIFILYHLAVSVLLCPFSFEFFRIDCAFMFFYCLSASLNVSVGVNLFYYNILLFLYTFFIVFSFFRLDHMILSRSSDFDSICNDLQLTSNLWPVSIISFSFLQIISQCMLPFKSILRIHCCIWSFSHLSSIWVNY